ncbi:MAG TPA: hypothetical protein VGF69_09855 [Thermoanaerobaculia bacterium]|jgi:hypothetical protein
MKRTASLLIVLSLVVLAAPAAMAECFICRFSYATCRPATATSTNAWTQCFSEDGVCELSGSPCTVSPSASAAIPAPLASDYRVASVERLDEPQQNAGGLIAAVAAPAPATR